MKIYFPPNVIIIFLYISSYQNGLNDLSLPCGCLFMVDIARSGISKCIRKTKENKGVQTFNLYLYILISGKLLAFITIYVP